LIQSHATSRVNLPAVEASLRSAQRSFESVNDLLGARRDPLDDRVIENMLAGYAYVDTLVADGVDLFALGNSKHFLELNTLVLCGTSPARRAAYAGHIDATERRFYEEQQGGVRDLVEWQALHKDESCWKQAAGAYVRILSAPQLFIEGNHRTGALVMSYLLVRGNQPPFVLTVENARAYFDPSTVLRDAEKNGPAMLFRVPGIRKRLAALLRECADRRHLLT
jgi:hypothetical protein